MERLKKLDRFRTPTKRLEGRLHAWHDVGMLTVDAETGHSDELNSIVAEVRMEIPSLADGEIGMLAHHTDDPAMDGNKRTLESSSHVSGAAVRHRVRGIRAQHDAWPSDRRRRPTRPG